MRSDGGLFSIFMTGIVFLIALCVVGMLIVFVLSLFVPAPKKELKSKKRGQNRYDDAFMAGASMHNEEPVTEIKSDHMTDW